MSGQPIGVQVVSASAVALALPSVSAMPSILRGCVLLAAGAIGLASTTLAQVPRVRRDPGAASAPTGLSVYGQRAIVRWQAKRGGELRVNFGPTAALGTQVVGQSPDLQATQARVVTYVALLDGLQPERSYHYQATLVQNGAVLAQSAIVSFTTPRVFIRVRPLRLDVLKDADRNVGGPNKGEVHFSWRLSLEPMSHYRLDRWPEVDALAGCYPPGGTWTIGVPQTFRIPLFDLTGNPPGQDPSGDYIPPHSLSGCVEEEEMATPFASKQANTVKVKSGEVIELQAQAMEWQLPAARPEPIPERPRRQNTRRPVTKACDPSGELLPVYGLANGFEIDEINDPRTGASDIRVRKQSASGYDVACFDLRERGRTVMLGVKASGEGLSFIAWFQIDLQYRR
jgi:hypothetical protein